MAKDYATENPAFTSHNVTGVAANHSSLTRSVAPGDDAQSDDVLQNVPPPQDPNISGTPETSQLPDWKAGRMSAWQENDDYREFFEGARVAESATSHRFHTVHDGDYDDNRGYATSHGLNVHVEGGAIHGLLDEPKGLEGGQSFPLGPVILRRI